MKNQRGFNLIEVMIGLTIGLIALLAVAQVFATFNQQRNTATQTMEAQSNGALALYLIERDLAMSGYGLMNLQDCANIQWYWNPPGCTGGGCGVQSPLSTRPLLITDGGAASDQIEINYAQSTSAVPGSLLTQDQAAATEEYHLASTAGYATGDMVVVNVGGSCTMSQTTDANYEDLTLFHATTSEYNPAVAPPAGATGGWDIAAKDDLLVNLGTYVSKRYRVSSNTLQMAIFPETGTYSTVVEGILLLKMEYGMDTNNDDIIDTWADGTTAITSANVTQVMALRVGIVARSPLQEKDAVDAPAVLTVLPDQADTVANEELTWAVPDTHYRYKAYYTLIPLRNVIWGRA